MPRPFIAMFASPVEQECINLKYDYGKDISVTGDNQPIISVNYPCNELLTKTEVQREDDDDAFDFLTKTKVEREDDDDYF
ncbi:hypothetical protein [Desulfoscipio geothermicus]|uniref:Uncharacterized protein n=1 Tax=Desulfoscipio geothermicus DSM 3669 TaxID=1121426 RepID=A0A1I6E928_9FIRM|nr:hypothetical protein [Desulfoscipio geothermicus]SFR14216.1 hypothetical protein SAMN05660706_13031 [Desulfoscipio geothermicus DSM 3669]